MNAFSRYALIPVAPSAADPPNALAVGPLADATRLIPSSIALTEARADIDESLSFLQDSAHKLQRLAHGLAEQKSAYAYQVINDLCDGIAAMSQRLDAYVHREAERQRLARADARKAVEDSLPDPDYPDLPTGALPAPNLQPSLPPADYDEHGYDSAEGEDGPRMPGKPAELPADRPDAVGDPDPDLPEGVGVSGIPSLGTMPVPSPEDLGHPQPSKQTPFAVGGP
jgi:hypothetical protein